MTVESGVREAADGEFTLRCRSGCHMALILTVLMLGLLTYLQLHRFTLAEDAHIMFRYAQNLARGDGLVWNPGEDPVEGATAFLWTLLLAATYALGLNFEISVPLLNAVFVAATILAVYVAAVRIGGAGPLSALAAASAVAVSPLVVQVRAGFETPMFALFLLVQVIVCLRLALDGRGSGVRDFAVLAVSGLLGGLTRPEGVLFAVMCLVSAGFLVPRRKRGGLTRTWALLFVLPGAIYFVWRWNYFGYPLPNTFYAKRLLGVVPLSEALEESLTHLEWLLYLLTPYLTVIAVYLLRAGRERRRLLAVLAPLLLFPMSYCMIYQIQNIGMRFQVSVLPGFMLVFAYSLSGLLTQKAWALTPRKESIATALVVWIVSAGLGAVLWYQRTLFLVMIFAAMLFLSTAPGRLKHWRPRTSASVSLMVLFVILLTARVGVYTQAVEGDTVLGDRAAVGRALAPYAARGYTMVSSETGYLPYYSGWRAIDPGGLYDEHIAHQGLSAAYLSRIHPELIMFSAQTDAWSEEMGGDYWGGKWTRIVHILYTYATENGYTLAAIARKREAGGYHWYWVRGDCPDSTGLLQAIRGAIERTHLVATSGCSSVETGAMSERAYSADVSAIRSTSRAVRVPMP